MHPSFANSAMMFTTWVYTKPMPHHCTAESFVQLYHRWTMWEKNQCQRIKMPHSDQPRSPPPPAEHKWVIPTTRRWSLGLLHGTLPAL